MAQDTQQRAVGLREERGTYSDDDTLGDVGCQRVVLVLRVGLQGYHEHEIPAESGERSGCLPATGSCRASFPSTGRGTKVSWWARRGTSPLLVLRGTGTVPSP